MRAVMLDFLIRYGHVTADNEPAYIELQAALHRPRLRLSDAHGPLPALNNSAP